MYQPRGYAYLLILGAYLTLRGYHAFDGDQAYRLPLLLHRQAPALYVADPFVRAFDVFNPHRGSLTVLSVLSGSLGLSFGLIVAFVATFLATCRGIDRLASCVWRGRGPAVGLVAVALMLTARAGNIGTNHLFEAMVLDRLMALAFGWNALAEMVGDPRRGWWRSGVLLGFAAFIHPSLGLQLGMVASTAWAVWAVLGASARVGLADAIRAIAMLGACLVPGLLYNLGPGGSLLDGLHPEEFRILATELQGPQHMLPHLWRMPQWLAFAGYLALAGLTRVAHASCATGLLGTPSPRWGEGARRADEGADTRASAWSLPHPGPLPVGARATALRGRHAATARPGPPATRGHVAPSRWNGIRPDGDGPQSETEYASRLRLSLLLGVVLAWLGAAWLAVEVLHDLRITVFQPFRMATVARGLALVLASGRVVDLWRRGDIFGRMRAALVVVGLAGDWMFFVAAAAELAATLGERWSPCGGRILFAGAMFYGLYFLSRHDTESGHWPLLAVLGAAVVLKVRGLPTHFGERDSRAGRLPRGLAITLAWAVPAMAFAAAIVPGERSALARGLVARCRYFETPLDDVERLAAWCKVHTPESALFIGPPGPKTFRLWSRRSLAFNRAGSPYHAEGLADWFRRFQDHVGVYSPPAEFVRLYLSVQGRHAFEARYDRLDAKALAALAVRQGADHVIARSDVKPADSLQRLHSEGRYAVYSVTFPLLSQRQR